MPPSSSRCSRSQSPPPSGWGTSSTRSSSPRRCPRRWPRPPSNSPVITVHLHPDDLARELRDDVRAGLRATPKSLPPKWLYDDRGSQLFEEITRLPEYYPFRAEAAILATRAEEIAKRADATTLVELGSGTSEKTRQLIGALRTHGSLELFVPFDVSEATLRAAAAELSAAHDGLRVHGVVGDFGRHLELLPREGRRLIAFLGGTIGNLYPEE